MEWFEIIHIRLFSQKESEEALKAFSRLRAPDIKGAVKGMKLLQDVGLDTDLRIIIWWQDKIADLAKSRFGLQLAAAFAKFGRIHHTVCRECKTSERSDS